MDLTYDYDYLGDGLSAIENACKGGSAYNVLKKAEKPIVIVGPSVFYREDRDAFLTAINTLVSNTS